MLFSKIKTVYSVRIRGVEWLYGPDIVQSTRPDLDREVGLKMLALLRKEEPSLMRRFVGLGRRGYFLVAADRSRVETYLKDQANVEAAQADLRAMAAYVAGKRDAKKDQAVILVLDGQEVQFDNLGALTRGVQTVLDENGALREKIKALEARPVEAKLPEPATPLEKPRIRVKAVSRPITDEKHREYLNRRPMAFEPLTIHRGRKIGRGYKYVLSNGEPVTKTVADFNWVADRRRKGASEDEIMAGLLERILDRRSKELSA